MEAVEFGTGRYCNQINNRSGKFTYTTHNEVDDIDCMGTSLAGEIEISFYDLFETFGRPEDGDGYKLDAHWSIEWEDGKGIKSGPVFS